VDKTRESRRVLYSGRVQGVGFRYTAHELAQRRGLTGFVRNLPDGRVELVAEGTAEQLTGLMHDIAEGMAGYIEDADTHALPYSGKYNDFRIAR
jgi:acylphosphatase